MKYFAEFNEAGERTVGYVADGMPYSESDIRERFPNAVEISEEDQNLYVTGLYIRGEDGRPVLRPPYVPTLAERKATKLQEIDTWTATAITRGFVSLAMGAPHTYDSEQVDQDNIKLMHAASLGSNFDTDLTYQGRVPIRAIPDGQTAKIVLMHNKAQLQALIDDMARHIGYCKQIGWQLQGAVAEATTAEDLAGIVWPE